jgi:hypothetical protein
MLRFESPRRRAAPAVTGALLLLLAASLVTGCASGVHASSQKPTKLVTFSSPQYGFTIGHPAGWTQVTNPEAVLRSSTHVSFSIWWKESTPSGATGGIGVGVLGHGPRLSVADQQLYFRHLLAEYRRLQRRKTRDSGGYVFDKVRPGRIDGEPAVWVHGIGPVSPAGTSAIECWYVVAKYAAYDVVVSGTNLGWVSAHANLAGTFHIQ